MDLRRNDGLWQIHVENRIVPIIERPEFGVQCHVSLLDIVCSKLPTKAHTCFYIKPLTALIYLCHGVCPSHVLCTRKVFSGAYRSLCSDCVLTHIYRPTYCLTYCFYQKRSNNEKPMTSVSVNVHSTNTDFWNNFLSVDLAITKPTCYVDTV